MDASSVGIGRRVCSTLMGATGRDAGNATVGDAAQGGREGVYGLGGSAQRRPVEVLADCPQAVAEVGLQGSSSGSTPEIVLGDSGADPCGPERLPQRQSSAKPSKPMLRK